MKKMLLFFLATVTLASINAQNLTPDQLQQHVRQFAAQMHHTRQLSPVTAVWQASPAAYEAKQQAPITLFNVEGGGFVVACADLRTRTILGYAPKGSINPDNMAPGLRYWLGQYAEQYRQLGDNQPTTAPTGYGLSKELPISVPPLLVTAWNQRYNGYNSACPTDSTLAALDYHATAGCVATAMAQIIRYWQFPAHGDGVFSYNLEGVIPCWRYGTLTVNYTDTHYDFANMPFQLDSTSTPQQREAVATLLYHCGVAATTAYNVDCNGSSGSNYSFAHHALVFNFHYASSSLIRYRSLCDAETWKAYLRTDLAAGRPVFYSGVSQLDDSLGYRPGGHSFVCDGYDSADYFHFNWGWQGEGNGYYSLDLLNPRSYYNFSHSENAIFGLQPDTGSRALIMQQADLVLDTIQFLPGEPISGSFSMTNIGDTTGTINIGVCVYDMEDNYMGCLDGRHLTLQPGQTEQCDFAFCLPDLPAGNYFASLRICEHPFAAGCTVDSMIYYAIPNYVHDVNFAIIDTLPEGVVSARRSQLLVFPNPTMGRVVITLPVGNVRERLSLYDRQGRQLLCQQVEPSAAGRQLMLDLSAYAPDLYLLRYGNHIEKVLVR